MRGFHHGHHHSGYRGFFFPKAFLFMFLLFMTFKLMPFSLIFLLPFAILIMMKRMFWSHEWEEWGAEEKHKNDEYEKPKRGENFQTRDGETFIITDDDGTTYV